MTVAAISHIVIDDKGVARIAGKRTRVVDIVLDTQAYQMTPEQIQAEHPDLSLAQIFAALSYYHDHKRDMDALIARQSAEAEQLRAEAGESKVAKKLRDAGQR